MTWGRYDDRAPFHRKWFTLSNDAVATMWRATQWARSPEAHARPGYLTRDELRLHSRLRGKKFDAVLKELINAGRPSHEFGLLEATEDGGFVIHDFADYGPRAVETQDDDSAAARRADAARRAGEASAAARRARTGTAQPSRRPSEAPFENAEPASGVHPVSERVSNDSRTEPQTTARTDPERSRTSGSDPREEKQSATAATKDLSGGARESRSTAVAAAPASPFSVSEKAEKVSCPKDLALSAEQVEELHAMQVPDYAITAAVTRFRGKAGNWEARTVGAWNSSLFSAVQGMWMDPKQRPKAPDSFDKHGPGTAKTDGDSGYEWQVTLDGRRVRVRAG